MKARLSPQREAEIAARAEAATDGSWRQSEDYNDIHSADGDHLASYWHTADGEFITHARTDVPALLTELAAVRAERDEARAQLSTVAEFVAKRAEYITAINNCSPNNRHDYNRWQGHAESRRQLAQQLGLPVAWPADYEQGATS